MTQEEAIKLLNNITSYCDFEDEYGDMIDSTPYYEAVELAIKALEQRPSDDVISREAVIKHICESKECYKDECKGRLYKRCYDLQWIYDLPSVTPKFTDTEIQKMQELEQAQLEKAYELGKAEIQPSEDCISKTELLAKIDEERKHLLDLKMDGAEHILVHHARRIIEDMPAVTPKASEDCISREAALAESQSAFKKAGYGIVGGVFEYIPTEAIRKLPSVTPKTGSEAK